MENSQLWPPSGSKPCIRSPCNLAEVITSTSLTSLPSLRLIGQKVAPPQEREMYPWRDLFLGFYFLFFTFYFLFYFFSVTPFDKTCRPILTYNSSNGAAWPKEVPFWGYNHHNSNFGGLRAPKSPKFAPV